VIYDDEMAEDDLTTQAWTLVHVMERFIGDSGLIYYLKDGFQAFEEEDWLESTEPPSNSSNAGIVQNNPTLLNIPRRSVSYTIGESKNDLHRRTSLFSLDTQAARVNNANALARRANRRSQQVKKSEEIIPPAVALNQVSEDDEAVALMTDASPRTETEFGFVISEIIPGFLYVGPEVETVEQANQLDDRKIKRILNMAEECNDDVEGLKERMVYRKISARDTVEMKNIELVIMEAVQFIGNVFI
jgi:cob(I)alamin adenosyltransferase